MDLREKVFKRKRFQSFIIVLGYVFLGGCEDVVIFPTCWNFLQTLGVTEEYWLGFTVAIYSVSASFAGVIGGRMADKYYKYTKTIIVCSIIFRSLGNFQYMFGINIWNVLLSRFVCGMGAASGACLVAEVCRTTTVQERKFYISVVTASFQIGIVIGPGLQIFLSYFDFTVFGFAVTPLNAPGLFLGVIWLLYWLATMLVFSNLTQEFRDIEREKLENNSESEKILAPIGEETSGKMDKTEKEGSGVYERYKDEFITDSYVFLMFNVFMLYFQQVGIETVIPVITENSFGFGIHENTLIYWSGGLEALTAFAAIIFFGKYVRESTLLIVGLTLIVTAHVWLFCVMPSFERGDPSHAPYFLVGTFLIYLGSPFINAGNAALASKVLSNETQGLGQGFRRLMVYIGVTFGPTWAGSTVHMPRLFMGVTLALLLANCLMLAGSFKNLRKAEDKTMNSTKIKQVADEESSPLLPNKLCTDGAEA